MLLKRFLEIPSILPERESRLAFEQVPPRAMALKDVTESKVIVEAFQGPVDLIA